MKGIIRLCYSKLIDASCTGVWERRVFDDTHKEFFMQAQEFDPSLQHKTFREMKAHLPTADELQYLVSTAAAGYLQQLNKMIPDVVNVAGQPCLPFHQFQFEIVQSHIQDKRQHQAMIHFHSEPLLWIDSLDHYLIFADGSQSEKYTSGQEIETDTLVFRLGLSIRKFQCYEN